MNGVQCVKLPLWFSVYRYIYTDYFNTDKSVAVVRHLGRDFNTAPVLSVPDVCSAVCGREPGPHGPHIQTAQGEDPGHHRVLQPPVPRVPGTGAQANPHLPQILPSHEEERDGGTSLVQRVVTPNIP